MKASPRIPLIEDLTTGPVIPGAQVLVEYDPVSVWYDASVSIAAGWLKTGGRASYNVAAQSPEHIRLQLKRLALNVEKLEEDGTLEIDDWYTATLGQKSKERYSLNSMKVHDLSIMFAKQVATSEPQVGYLMVRDDLSVFDRFNEEKNWVEFLLTRMIPGNRGRQFTSIRGLMKGIHSNWAYKQLEAAVDGVVDFKLDETTDPPTNLMRIKSMRNIGFDGRWHQLKRSENSEVTLV